MRQKSIVTKYTSTVGVYIQNVSRYKWQKSNQKNVE